MICHNLGHSAGHSPLFSRLFSLSYKWKTHLIFPNILGSKSKSPKRSKSQVHQHSPDRPAASWGFGKQYLAEENSDTDPGLDSKQIKHPGKHNKPI